MNYVYEYSIINLFDEDNKHINLQKYKPFIL